MEKQHRENAVKVENLSVSYDKNLLVLKYLNMSVDVGSIYGLLGSSGCGKTTLLSCILGLRKMNSGQVSLFGLPVNGTPGPVVGYMPQEIGLYDSFTIAETFNYFASMYSIPYIILQQQVRVLMDLLSIPNTTCSYIKNLSGGEKRRVSLAVALLHNPKLVILDEPTVGVDPLLRERIWEYLSKRVESNRITIMVTTHYPEEARHCNKIGYLRTGRLIVEDEPQYLLDRFQTNFLEDVVLQLSRQDDCIKDLVLTPDIKTGKPQQTDVEGLSYNQRELCEVEVRTVWTSNHHTDETGNEKRLQSFSSKLRKVKGLVIRNWINEFRHIQLVLILVSVPIVHVLLGVYVLGKSPAGLGLAVVDRDNYLLMNQPLIKGIPNYCQGNSSASFYSCIFMKQLEASTSNLEIHATQNSALESVIRGTNMGYIMIPANFTYHLQNRLLYRIYAENETLVGSTISVRLDMSEYIRRLFMVRTLVDGFYAFIGDIIKGFNVDYRAGETPLKFKAIYGSDDSSWREYLMPVYLLISCFILQTVVGLFHVLDSKTGTLQRTLCTGATESQIFASYFFSTVPILASQTLVMILITANEVKIEGSWSLVFLQCFLAGLSGVAFGLMCGSLFDHEMEVVFGVLCILLSSQSLSGISWPLDDVVWVYRIICYSLPLTTPLSALRSIMSRGWGISHPQVLLGLTTSFVYIFGFLLVIVVWRKYKTMKLLKLNIC